MEDQYPGDRYYPTYQEPAPERYGRLRVRTSDLGPAHRLAARFRRGGAMGTVGGVVAPGFAAYARVPHPVPPGEPPWEGPTPPEVARALIPVLARHTRTPERCWFGLWVGYGRWDFGRFPSFETPGRDEVLLAGTLDDAVSPVDVDEFAELPDLWWPQDGAWCLGGDVDLVSTYVGGSPELIADLLAVPDLGAYPVGAGDGAA